MALLAIDALIGNLEVFRGLSAAQISIIAREAERMMLKPGQTIIQEGEAGEAAYVVAGGECDIVTDDDDASDLPFITPGSLVGEMAMLIEHDYRLTVVARTTVKVIKLSRSTLHRLMLNDPSLAEHFVGKISSRLLKIGTELRRIDQALALSHDGHHAST